MKKIYYNGYYIIELDPNKQYIATIDWSYHNSLLSAKCHIDYLAK